MKSKAIVVTIFFMLVSVSSARAQYIREYSSSEKLGRGLVNVVTSPIEVIRGVDLTSKNKGAAKGWTIVL